MPKSIFTLTTALALMVASYTLNATEEKSMLQCHIQAPQTVKIGAPVPLTFKLSNSSDATLSILKWNTPLEGWFADAFKVTLNDKEVLYQGPMVKRFRPSEEDYVEIAAGKSVEAEVNMAEGYDMSASGRYNISFKGRIQDIQRLGDGTPLSKNRTMHLVKCNELTLVIE